MIVVYIILYYTVVHYSPNNAGIKGFSQPLVSFPTLIPTSNAPKQCCSSAGLPRACRRAVSPQLGSPASPPSQPGQPSRHQPAKPAQPAQPADPNRG